MFTTTKSLSVIPKAPPHIENRLVEALPSAARDWFLHAANRVFLRRGTILVGPGDVPQYMYFPIDALIVMWDRYAGTDRPTCVQIAGRLRVAAYMYALHWKRESAWVQVLCSGDAWRLPYEAFESCAAAPLHGAIARLACASLTINGLRLHCAAEHNVKQRIATWLLYLAEERGRSEIPATHELIAAIGTIRRPSVSIVLAQLARAGTIRNLHGHIDIIDRPALLKEACACFTTTCSILDGAAPG